MEREPAAADGAGGAEPSRRRANPSGTRLHLVPGGPSPSEAKAGPLNARRPPAFSLLPARLPAVVAEAKGAADFTGQGAAADVRLPSRMVQGEAQEGGAATGMGGAGMAIQPHAKKGDGGVR